MTGARWHDLLADQLRRRPQAPALSDSTGAEWSYADLDRACQALEQALRGCGIRPGDRVMILAENCAAAVAALFAASRVGAWAVPVNARLTASEIDRIVTHCRPAAVLATTGVSPEAEAHIARLQGHALSGPFGQMALAQPFGPEPEARDDVAVILYTTGTTGTPKGVMLSHANLRFGGQSSAELRQMTPQDRIYGVLPITHVFGLSSIVTAGISAGAPILLEPRFSPARLYQALGQGITLLSAVPQIHAQLMHYTRQQGHERLEGSALRYVSSGAAPLDPVWKREAEAFFGVALQNGYGLTESTAGTCVTQSALGDPDTSCGPPLPGVEVAIDHESRAARDGIGEVLTRGPHVMLGYFRNPEATVEVLSSDGWLRTGDLGWLDGQGRLHIAGRLKELIIHGGFNVYPPEVEAALNDHPQVIHAAVVGRARDGDEEVVAFVKAAPDDLPDALDLRAFAAKRLAGYKCPGRIIVATDLPAAPTGKILKHKLLAHFADRLDDDTD